MNPEDANVLLALGAIGIKTGFLKLTLSDWDGERLFVEHIRIMYGDSNCSHDHRYDPETGHGFLYIDEEFDYKSGHDTGISAAKRAIDRFNVLVDAPYECKECKEILEGTREYNR